MKNLLIALTLVLTATTATASNTNVKFVTADNSTESSLCISAAKNGLKSALRKSHKKLNHDIICNGQSIREFSKNYNVEAKKVNDNLTTQFLVIPANENSASKVCAQAVRSGIDSVKNTVDFNVKNITCNGKSISKFVKAYKNT
ncbi:hypothetical protein [Colwellia sp. 20A7]|uniref:hypothetical protein n=1 Tax=Colwellia sp. 20A7 TaxID=2689569 RepID=UPI001356DADA|nr:hypothetical protein [Colwellia sp. 20A7]